MRKLNLAESILYTFLAILLVLGLMQTFCGCSLIGGGDSRTTVKPSAELENKLKQNKEDIDKSKKELKDIQGDVSTWEQRISNNETNIHNNQTQINNTSTNTTNNNETLKSIIITISIIYFCYEGLKLLRALLIAKLSPGSTVKNIFSKLKGK